MRHVADQGPNSPGEPPLGDRRAQPLDARRVVVQRRDQRAGQQLREVERLPADAAAEVEHDRRLRPLRALAERLLGSGAVARTLPGQILEDLEEHLPEPGA